MAGVEVELKLLLAEVGAAVEGMLPLALVRGRGGGNGGIHAPSGSYSGELRPFSFRFSFKNSIAIILAGSNPWIFELNVLLRLIFPSIQKASQACIRLFHDTPRHPDRYY